ncbi:MAG: S41 family peptidase [Fimbriiglobus sp.]
MSLARMLSALGVVLMLLSPVTRAEEPPAAGPSQGPYVVIVGAGEFQDAAITARPTAEADARAFYDFFSNPKYLTTPERVTLLTSQPDAARKSLPASKANITKAIQEAVSKTGKDDTLIIAMFGRGAPSGEQTCLFMPETKFAERAKTSFVGADLESTLKMAKDRKICILLDIAFKGFEPGKEKLAEPTLSDMLKAVFGGDDKGELPPPQNKLVILGNLPTSMPLVVGENGLFAKTTLEALKGAADDNGYEADGLVIVDELVKFLEDKIPEQARTLGKTAAEKESAPFIVGEEVSHFTISKNPAVTAKTETRLKAIQALLDGKSITVEIAEEGKKLISQMPKLKTPQELRKQYQALADAKIAKNDFLNERNKLVEQMKISPDAAEKYAKLVLRAVDAVRSDYVKEVSVGEWGALAVKGLYRRLELTIPADIEAQLKEPKSLDRTAINTMLKDVRTRIGAREDLDAPKDVDMTVTMMFGELKDPYTTYYDAETIKKLDAPLRGEFRGVGIQIRRDLVRDGLLVASPIKGSPAYKAGIQAGDLITAIKREVGTQGEPLKPDEPKVISTKGMKTEKALEIILGKVGVPITLEIERNGEKKDYVLRRGLISVETVLGVKRDEEDNWDFMVDPENKIGYVCLTQFTPTTVKDLGIAVEKLKALGMKGMVLDLRYNPGGFLQAAVSISDFFLDEDGVIVSVKYRNRAPETYHGKNYGKNVNFPMAVLINGQSASASEIVSACLQDYGRAVVVGERSYGKGSVQNIKDFSSTNGQIKLTIARYFPPYGKNIDKLSTSGKPEDVWGVVPDKGYEVKLTREQSQEMAEFFRDREIIQPKDGSGKEKKNVKDQQLEKALEYLREQVKAGMIKPKKNG